jgi:glutamate synthase (NADPH/NADH) small chain
MQSRVYAAATQGFLGDAAGGVRALRLVEVDESFQAVGGTEREIPAQLVLLAMGFTGPQCEGLLEQLGVELDERGNIARDASYATSADGVFVAGDAGRGQSLIVWAIAEGRSAASAVDRYLTGDTSLPSPIPPTARPLVV